MVDPENASMNWLYDYGDEEIPGFSDQNPGILWPTEPLNPQSNPGVEIDGSFGESDGSRETGQKKRARNNSCASTSSKACREKQRRDRLNDRFVELAAILEPGKPPKTDKGAVLIDAVRIIIQLKNQTQKLKESKLELQERIKDLKAEKNELREEKQKLKAEKEKLDQQIKTMIAPQPHFVPAHTHIPAAYATGNQASGNKMVPVISYLGVAMRQFMPPAVVDTSEDHALRSPVA